MNTIFKKVVVLCCILSLWIAQHSFAQDYCFNCNADSLVQILHKAKTDNEKIRILTLLIDLKVFDVGSGESSKSDSMVLENVQSLIKLSATLKVKNIEAYKSLSEALQSLNKKNYLAAQSSFIKSISLFDKSHRKIPHLLAAVRYTYNSAGNQEDRLQFYTDKLHYYLINGPFENVAPCYHGIGGYYLYKADYNKALSNYLKAAEIYKKFDNQPYLNDLGVIAMNYANWGNNQKALEYFKLAIEFNRIVKDNRTSNLIYNSLSNINRTLKNYPEALLYADSALTLNNNHFRTFMAISYVEKALTLICMNRLQDGIYNLNHAKQIADSAHSKVYSASGAMEIDFGYYQYYSAIKKYEEAGRSLKTAYEKSVEAKSNELQLKYLRELSFFYGQQHNVTLASEFLKKFFDLTDQLNREHSSFKIAQYENEEKEIQQNDSINVLRQHTAIQSATIKKSNTILWGSLIALIIISVSLFFVFRQYQLNKKILSSLRKTQRQLILSEKMASLGELTAGIAHEIQNPLNFVNNFSEINTELIAEMKLEIEAGNLDEVKAIASDIEANEKKITQHGKRADAIVKGMLQHSRSSTGVKESTNINALADEYLRLAYHGLRAKDKSFNAAMKTDFDESIGNINIIPQDIGRVILNLITNAFYAVTDKKQQLPVGYEPTVSVSTRRTNGKVEIKVADNGNGIPQKALDKIFQPFFTTKPSGQGTGLGLSMSYEIVTKGHGGELKVDTKEGEGAEFTIILPV